MTAPDIAELRRLLAAGTRGPWHDHVHEGGAWIVLVDRGGSTGAPAPTGYTTATVASGEWNGADAALIAAAVNALPALLDEVEQARAGTHAMWSIGVLEATRDDLRSQLDEVERLRAESSERWDVYEACKASLAAVTAERDALREDPDEERERQFDDVFQLSKRFADQVIDLTVALDAAESRATAAEGEARRLREALSDAARSLETASKWSFDATQSRAEQWSELRQWATSRAMVARAALAAAPAEPPAGEPDVRIEGWPLPKPTKDGG